jgi:hypothetical protein
MIGLSFLFYFPDFDATHCGGWTIKNMAANFWHEV